MKPSVVLFGELLPLATMRAAQAAARAADVMLVAGSSLEVAPAGELPLLAHANGARLIFINRQPTQLDDLADVVIRGDVADVLPRLAGPWVGDRGVVRSPLSGASEREGA
jgi:NAD-dependent deacetylase